jgi:hypothetical protein
VPRYQPHLLRLLGPEVFNRVYRFSVSGCERDDRGGVEYGEFESDDYGAAVFAVVFDWDCKLPFLVM